MAELADISFMQRALELAAKGRGMTYPNPLVGAVLVKGGRIVGEGYHRRVGGHHAEVEALRAAGSRAKGATLYVTLEPCNHTGRTGPCTEAVIGAGVKRVVYAVQDPDPRVNGRGASRLRQAGVEVSSGVMKKDAIALNEAYFHHLQTGRPFVILKLAHSLDGRIATCSGHSQWISGKEARMYVHRLRSEVGAVLVGGGTARCDNPSLTVRLVKGQQPHRIVLSRTLDFNTGLNLLSANSDRKTILASSEEAVLRFVKRAPHAELTYWSIDTDDQGMLSLTDFLAKAGQFGLRSILVEGGSRLATSFLTQGLVNKYISVIAPKVVGKGIEAVGDLQTREIGDAIVFARGRFVPCGADVIFEGYPMERK